MYRGYDSPELFRHDTMKRIRWLDSEISKIQGKILETESSDKPSSDKPRR